ncbi:MAG TPA: dienelactone hydrolase family protein [Planctomycetota bacterium]
MNLHTNEVAYTAKGVPLRGFVAWDEGRQGKRPGVLVVHEWWGHDEYVRGRARQLAGLGYAALAVDMYGTGKVAKTPQEAGNLMTAVTSDLATMRARFEAARDVLVEQAPADAQRLAAIGYCFGGAVVLQMARLGLELRAVASFHPGSLAPAQPAKRDTYKARTLVCLGADDPFVPAEQRADFRQEMQSAGVACELVEYPGVVHGFTVEAATARGKTYGLPLAYDAQADGDSWRRLVRLLESALA